jgi:hypothetical protein
MLAKRSFGAFTVICSLFALLAGTSVALADPSASIDINVNPATAHPRQQVTLSASLANTSGADEVISISYVLSGPNGVISQFETPTFTLPANANFSGSIPFRAPRQVGTYTLTANVLSGRNVIATDTATLTVTTGRVN